MSDSEYVSADELAGGAIAAEGASDFKPPTDVLLALRPMGHKTVTMPGGKDFDAIEAFVIGVTEAGYEEYGLRDVGWQFVIRELDNATDEAPWVVGTITKKSRAYFLVPPTVDEMKQAVEAIARLVEDRREAERAEQLVSDAFGTAPAQHDPLTEEPF